MSLAAGAAYVGAVPESARTKEWELTKGALNNLLAFLDADPELAGRRYVALYGKLTKFFEWRGCAAPDVSADETLNRVARKIEQGAVITNFNGFLYGVARNVLNEDFKKRGEEQRRLADFARFVEARETREPDGLLTCLESCLLTLPAGDRELLLAYYQGCPHRLTHRQELARRHGLSINALRVRVHRLRLMLEQRVTNGLSFLEEGAGARKIHPGGARRLRPAA